MQAVRSTGLTCRNHRCMLSASEDSIKMSDQMTHQLADVADFDSASFSHDSKKPIICRHTEFGCMVLLMQHSTSLRGEQACKGSSHVDNNTQTFSDLYAFCHL